VFDDHVSPKMRGVFVRVWLDPEVPLSSTPEALSIVQTCPIFSYAKMDEGEEFVQQFIHPKITERDTMRDVASIPPWVRYPEENS
jgi:hypothetical protein